ncbi:MAG: amidase [Hyphomicrobiales bacterium]|nr:amidase [Hyphomicrobiales bacterium]
MHELIAMTARQVVALLRAGEVTPDQVIDAALDRIAETDGAINALPILCEERARAAAADLSGDPDHPGWLAGLPLPIKDLTEVAGVRTTFGSPIFADYVPDASNVLVETLERRGGIVLAKSNTPEFGAGGNTFNEVFGATRNPWDTTRTSGGSSGGAAAALAAGQAWLAHGSDMGGSLRTPASFCGVVGLRPSPGRIACHPNRLPFWNLGIQGPMARNVGDLALLLDAMAGRHPLDPLSQRAPTVPFQHAAAAPVAPLRVAYSPDLGQGPVDPEVAAICAAAAARFADLGATVEEACPDLADAQWVFQTLRAVQFAAVHGANLERFRDKFKPEMVWNIEKAGAITAAEYGRAEVARGELFENAVRFFETYDLLLAPTAVTPAFDVDERYLASLGDHTYANYMEWLAGVSAITLTSCPALSLPCGVTAGGLPVGLQLVGPPRGEAALLGYAALAEGLYGMADRVPLDPITP